MSLTNRVYGIIMSYSQRFFKYYRIGLKGSGVSDAKMADYILKRVLLEFCHFHIITILFLYARRTRRSVQQ